MKSLMMIALVIMFLFSLQDIYACEKLETDVKFWKTAYDDAQKIADKLYVKFKKKEFAFYLGNSKKWGQGDKMYELQESVVAARIKAQKYYDNWQDKKKKLEDCLKKHDKCMSCNKYIPKGKPYHHRVFCELYMLQAHYKVYPTGRYWSCNAAEVYLHSKNTCNQSKYSGSGERCGRTYHNCIPQECQYESSFGITRYCNKYAY